MYEKKGGRDCMGTVLIVDDSAFMRMVLADILSGNGYRVVGEAENGVIVIEKYRELKPDAVLMDIDMPEMNGIEAVQQVKRIDPNAKEIICSVMGQPPMVIEAIQAGAVDFVVKPFQLGRIVEAVRRALS